MAVIRPGRVMLEVAGVTKEMATEALRLASRKFGIKTRFEDKHASL